MAEPDRRCQCPIGVDCFATTPLGGADQCPHEIDAEDLLCSHCRPKQGTRHCHSCNAVRGPVSPPVVGMMAAYRRWKASVLPQRPRGVFPPGYRGEP